MYLKKERTMGEKSCSCGNEDAKRLAKEREVLEIRNKERCKPIESQKNGYYICRSTTDREVEWFTCGNGGDGE